MIGELFQVVLLHFVINRVTLASWRASPCSGMALALPTLHVFEAAQARFVHLPKYNMERTRRTLEFIEVVRAEIGS